MDQISTSIIDMDLYKASMLQCYYEYYNSKYAKFRLFFRDDTRFTPAEYEEIKLQIMVLGTLRFSASDLMYLRSLGWFKDGFLWFLQNYRMYPESSIDMSLSPDGRLSIDIYAPIVEATVYETHIMGIISEVYFSSRSNFDVIGAVSSRLKKKIELSDMFGIKFAEFGSRRRHSKAVQQYVNEYCSKNSKFYVGTSNMEFARMFGVKAIGTMAHEWIMMHQAVTNIDFSEGLALKKWMHYYEGNLGIALTDTLTTDHFLRQFDGCLSRAFNGVRQDSGDPLVWMEKMIAHYIKHGIDPLSKQYIFSDGLNFEKAKCIRQRYSDYPISFGIGTDLTNDLGLKALNMVIKMVEFDGYPLIKMSDARGKILCEDDGLRMFCMAHIGYADAA